MPAVASFINKTILALNKKMDRGTNTHPLTLEKTNPGSYATWEYELAKKTLKYFPEEFVNPENFAGKSILDLCCGAGGKTVLLAEMNAHKVTGIDIDPGFIKMAKHFANQRKTENIHFETGDATNLKFPDNSFDYIFSFDALEHVDPPEKMLEESSRVLKPGGKLIMSFTNWERHDGHHMTDAINIPWIHMFISEKRLLKIYRSLVDEKMYLLRAGSLHSEKIAYVNKLRLKTAVKIIKNSNMKTLLFKPITYGGKMKILAGIPGLKKYFTRIIIAVMEATR